jgi:hypothetical protein
MDYVLYIITVVLILGLFFLVSTKMLGLVGVGRIKWLIDIVVITVRFWTNNKKYDRYLESISVFLDNVALIDHNTILSKEEKMVLSGALLSVQPDYRSGRSAQEVRLFMAGLTLALNYNSVKELLAGFSEHGSIKVKKLTLLTIDVLGVMLELKNELDTEFFQHAVFGINKMLRQLRDGGYTEKSLEKSAATLFRVYQLTRAYLNLHGRSNLTRGEFNEKFRDVFTRFLNVYC